MSVPKSKRSESSIEFLNGAFDLEGYTHQRCTGNFPKHARLFIAAEIYKLAAECHTNAKSANSIFVNNSHDAQMRLDYLTKAICDIQALYSKIHIAKKYVQFEAGKAPNWDVWIGMVEKEATLLVATRKAEIERYRKAGYIM